MPKPHLDRLFDPGGTRVLTADALIAESIDSGADLESPSKIYEKLRVLGLSAFGSLLYSLPTAQLPNISAALPKMADEQVQKDWTGLVGDALLEQSVAFVMSLAHNFSVVTGRTVLDADILDYGCGYGRLSRLMYYFTSPDRVIGVDPWSRSIDTCKNDGLGTNFLLSEYLPKELPINGKTFDLIYAFSVFTHLSERATRAALDTLRGYIKLDGLLAITIRPVEFWQLDQPWIDGAAMKANHDATGFAFTPHDLAPVDGDVTYGDTSMTIEWLDANFPQWKVVGVDRSVNDLYQQFVFLAPR